MSASTTNETLDAIAHWASSSDPVVFRHLRVSHGDFTHPSVRQAIWKSVTKHKDHVIFVGSKMETDVAKDDTWDSNSESPPTFATYVEFVDLLEKNRAKSGKGPEAWKEEWQSDGWILPSRVLIIMSIEPQMPCECALALVAAVHWAMDIAQRKDARARVLTMSPEEEALALISLLELYSVPWATQVDMSGALPKGYRTVCADPSELARQVLFNLTPEPTEKDIILCFPPDERAFSLGAHFQRLKTLGGLDKAWVESLSNYLPTTELVRSTFRSHIAPGHLVYMNNGFRAPCGIDGFDRVHIVLGSTDMRPVFDAVTGQITLTELSLSRDERLDQVSWIGRADCLPENIFVYLDTQHRTVEEFVDAGQTRRRLQVSNHQLGGFLGALAGISHWGLDVFQVAEQFVRENFALREMATRMTRQGILVRSSDSIYNGLTLGMRDDEPRIFKAVLPILNYDHRLAYFLARSSSSGLLRHLKVQVAAVMCVGPHDVVRLQDVAGKTAAEVIPTLINACWGCTRHMARKGAIWLMSGLWKRMAKEHGSFQSEGCQQSMGLLISDTDISVTALCSLEVVNIITALNDALSDLDVANWTKAIAKETKDLDLVESQQLELQRDLLYAYAYQLAGSVMHRGLEAGPLLLTHDISTRKMLYANLTWLDSILDTARQSEKKPNCVFGIYHFLSREGKDVGFQDWTWIPTQLIRDWDMVKKEMGTLHQCLSGNLRPTKNFDEIETDPSQ
ncbi:hypothetical protein EDB80DRAFT_686029 [Ilyonectria destructans]|nr:hypothetical protein EDB80DRAFT_686029 [Ilyonectria destructans]